MSARTPQRDDLRSLLGNRWVQALMLTTAVATVASTSVRAGSPRVAEGNLPAPAAFGEGTVVVPLRPAAPETVEQTWQRTAIERESQRLAAQYVRRGYSVTPELATKIHSAAVKHDIDPEIAFGLVRAESSFRNHATSPVGAVGLTQLMPATARWMQPGVTGEELRNPQTNLEIGFRYLRHLLDKYDGNEDLALLAYNRGPGTVDRALRRGMNPDNGYAAFVRGKSNHGHTLFTSSSRLAPRATAAKRPATAAKSVAKKPATTTKKTVAKASTARRPAAKATPAKRPAAKATPAKRPAAKATTTTKRPAAKATATKRPASKATAAKRPAPKKATANKR
jgi:soluble lytic murein transglycosylase-like protein